MVKKKFHYTSLNFNLEIKSLRPSLHGRPPKKALPNWPQMGSFGLQYWAKIRTKQRHSASCRHRTFAKLHNGWFDSIFKIRDMMGSKLIMGGTVDTSKQNSKCMASFPVY